MKGHGFLSYLSGAGAAEPLSAARAQQLRRVGVLLNLREQDPESKAYIAAFLKQLEELGWRVGSNLQVDYRWTAGAVFSPASRFPNSRPHLPGGSPRAGTRSGAPSRLHPDLDEAGCEDVAVPVAREHLRTDRLHGDVPGRRGFQVGGRRQRGRASVPRDRAHSSQRASFSSFPVSPQDESRSY